MLIALIACEPTITNPVGTRKLGSLGTDNSSFVYVSIGNSITAGMHSGAMFADASKYCFPKLLADQIGVANFVQPEYTGNGVGDRVELKGFNTAGRPILSTVTLTGSVGNAATYPKPFNNLGVPGAVAYDLIDTSSFESRATSRDNPLYLGILRNAQFGKSMVDQAIALNPNLITIEIGNNDVLGYSTSGGTRSTNGTVNPIPTPVENLQVIYTAALNKLTKALPNTKIIVFTNPNVLGVPYFNTIPWNALALDQANADMLNASPYSKLGFKFNPGPNGFIATSPKSPFGMRQLTANDYLLLTVPQDSLAPPALWGSKIPIPDRYVLDSLEAAVATKAVTDYNNMITGLKGISPNITIYDLNAVFQDVIKNGYKVPGGTALSNKFISGEMFSLDGVHPTSRGHGVLANELIKLINLTYGADIPLVNILNLPPNYVQP